MQWLNWSHTHTGYLLCLQWNISNARALENTLVQKTGTWVISWMTWVVLLFLWHRCSLQLLPWCCPRIDTKQVDLMSGYGTLSVQGTVLCVFLSPRSSQWFQTAVWTRVTVWWQTCMGTIRLLSLRKLTASKFTSAEYELAVPGGNFLEVYKSEDTESEGPWSQPRQAVTRRRLKLPCNDTVVRAGVKSLRTAGQNSS